MVKSTKAVVKAKKAAKIASLAAEASEMTRKAGNTLDTISDTMKAASKWGDTPLKLTDGITAEAGSKAMKALEIGGDFAKESNKAVWEMKAVVGADGVKLSTSADTSASLFKNGFVKTDGVAKSAKKSVSNTIDNRLVNKTFFNNGERVATTRQIRNYKKQMKSMGINVVVDKKGKVLSGNKAAGFDYSTGTIYIKKKAGIIDLYHEGYHAEQYLNIGQDNYVNLGTLNREEYVYSRIMENSSLFNDAELQGATKYIMRLRGN